MNTAPFRFYAYGHPQVSATHPTTLEITADNHLTHRGDCVIAVRATCGLREFPSHIKEGLSNDDARGVLRIQALGESFQVEGRGSKELTFRHSREIVVRKSTFVSERTLMVNADKSASDIPVALVHHLQKPNCRITIEVRTL